MLTYAQWDVIADAYIPCLAFILLAQMIYTLYLQQYRQLTGHVIIALLLITTVYIIRYIDNITQTWASFGLDYSTHTALALVILIAIGKFKNMSKTNTYYFLICSFAAYIFLMKWMNYHTVMDMLTTFVFLLICSAILIYSAEKITKCYRTHDLSL